MERSLGSKYLLTEPLGRGATGTVWRGSLRATGEPVAIKVLREDLTADPDVVTRFLGERTLLLRLRHPHLVAVRDLVVEGDVLALVMELVDGRDLRVHLREHGPPGPAAAARLMAGVLDALAVAHRSGVIHRDIKPGNILLRSGPDGPHPLLSDFGIARAADGPHLTRTLEVLGTPYYMAPETATGAPPTPAVDVYAAGVVLYELVAGQPPFDDGDPFVLMRRHLQDAPERPDGVPEQLWQLIARCLAKDPALRPDAAGVAATLYQVQARLERGGAGSSVADAFAAAATTAAATTAVAATAAGLQAGLQTGLQTGWSAQRTGFWRRLAGGLSGLLEPPLGPLGSPRDAGPPPPARPWAWAPPPAGTGPVHDRHTLVQTRRPAAPPARQPAGPQPADQRGRRAWSRTRQVPPPPVAYQPPLAPPPAAPVRRPARAARTARPTTRAPWMPPVQQPVPLPPPARRPSRRARRRAARLEVRRQEELARERERLELELQRRERERKRLARRRRFRRVRLAFRLALSLLALLAVFVVAGL